MANTRRVPFANSRYERTKMQGKRRVTFDVPSVLVEAAKRDDIVEVTSLMSTGALSTRDKCSALLTCCRNNSLQCARLLLERGVNVSCRDDDNWTPLHTASACGHTDMVELLLKFNADVGAVDIDGNLSVDHAKDDRITRVLTHYMGKHGLSEHGLHALRAQLAISMMVNIKGLGGRGRARLNALNENGVTMLHTTAACGYYEAAALLLSYGATVDVRDKHGLTPLHVAAKFNQLRMARLLLRSGANAKAAPGVPLPSWANEIISDAVSDPLPAIPHPDAVDFNPYSDPQPCSSFWKLSNLSKTDGQREGSYLARTWERNKKDLITSQQTASVENDMIYEDCRECLSTSSLTTVSSRPQLVEEIYDTAVVQEVLSHKAKKAWPQQSSLTEDDVYDDVQTVMNGGTTNNHDNDVYDDVQAVMSTTTTANQQSDDVYDDVQTVMGRKQPMMVWQASNKSSMEDNDMMYDDVKVVMNGGSKNHQPTNSWSSSKQRSKENDIYDDIQTVTQRNGDLYHQPNESDDVYDDVQTVMNGVHDSTSESVSSKPTANDKRHTYVNVSSDSYSSSVEESIYDDCVAASKPIVPVPYEEFVFHNSKQADKSHHDDYDDVDECTASLSSTSSSNDVKISPPSGRKVARRRSRLPTYTSSPSIGQPSKHPGLTKSYSDSSTTIQPPTPPIRRSSSPRPLPCTPSESSSHEALLHRRDSTPTQPPPPPPHSSRRHSPRNQGSRSAFPLSPPPVNTSSSPSSSPVFSRPIPEESLYADPDQPLTAPIYHKEMSTPITHNGMQNNWSTKAPPQPLPKPKRRTRLNK